jgi:hypothetical protein
MISKALTRLCGDHAAMMLSSLNVKVPDFRLWIKLFSQQFVSLLRFSRIPEERYF